MRFVKPFAREQASQTQKALGFYILNNGEVYEKPKKAFMMNDLPPTKGMTGSARGGGIAVQMI